MDKGEVINIDKKRIFDFKEVCEMCLNEIDNKDLIYLFKEIQFYSSEKDKIFEILCANEKINFISFDWIKTHVILRLRHFKILLNNNRYELSDYFSNEIIKSLSIKFFYLFPFKKIKESKDFIKSDLIGLYIVKNYNKINLTKKDCDELEFLLTKKLYFIDYPNYGKSLLIFIKINYYCELSLTIEMFENKVSNVFIGKKIRKKLLFIMILLKRIKINLPKRLLLFLKKIEFIVFFNKMNNININEIENMGYKIKQVTPYLLLTGTVRNNVIILFSYENSVDSEGKRYFHNLVGTRYFIGKNNKMVTRYESEITLDS